MRHSYTFWMAFFILIMYYPLYYISLHFENFDRNVSAWLLVGESTTSKFNRSSIHRCRVKLCIGNDVIYIFFFFIVLDRYFHISNISRERERKRKKNPTTNPLRAVEDTKTKEGRITSIENKQKRNPVEVLTWGRWWWRRIFR